MGFNISGLIINKNYKENLTELEEIIGEKLVFDKEVIYEIGSENWKDDDYCDIYYSEKGTLIFLSMEKGGFEFYAKNNDTFSFVLSEMTMTFSVNYVKEGKLIRSLVESEDNLMQDEGEKLEFEKSESDKSELIYYLFEKVLGESFHKIDLEAKCYRYKFSTEKNPTIEKKQINHPLIDQIKLIAESPTKSKEDMIKKMGAIEVLEGNLDPDLFAKKIGLKNERIIQTKKWWEFWK